MGRIHSDFRVLIFIKKMATAPTTTSDIAPWMGSASWLARYDSTQDSTSGTTSSVWYEAINVSNGQTYPTYGMEIRCDTSNSKNYIYIDSDDNTSHPNQVSVKPPNGTHGALASFVEVEVGDEVKFYKSVAEGSTLQQTWTVDAGRLFTFSSGSGGNNPGPLSNNPKIENIVITKSSDTSLTVSFDWENLDSFTLTNSRGGVVQTGN